MMPKQPLPLADIHLPDPVTAWPPAYGWWILTVLVLIALVLTVKAIKKWRAERVQKKLAISELASIDLTVPGAWQQINETLKRAAMAYYPREHIASLAGNSWKAFLLDSLKKKSATFDDNWLNFAYMPQVDTQHLADYYEFAETWLKQALPAKGGRDV